MPASKTKDGKTNKERATGKSSKEIYWPWIFAIAFGVTLAHSAHLHVLYENDIFFSHLSILERELSFRTEMGLYYSYYKTLVTASSFFQGLQQITHDNLTEYPSTINALQRFNLYPEVILGGVFRTWHTLLAAVGSSGVECSQISRGFQQPPVTACNGLGDPAYFYVWCVFALNGLMAGLIFVLGAYLSDSIMGGAVSLAGFFFNHGESTRVMWTPPLRESFAMPFLVLQLLSITYCMRQPSLHFRHYCLITLTTLGFLLPWQFSQFVLVTQSFSLLPLHSYSLLSLAQLHGLYLSLTAALFCNIILQFFNGLLLTSLLPLCTVSSLLVLHCRALFHCIPYKMLRVICEYVTVLTVMAVLKVIVNKVTRTSDDAHIAAILLSKLTSCHNFHTRLYTCSPEFDFLPFSYFVQTSTTLLLPASLVAAMLTVWRVLSGITTTFTAEQMYHTLQCASFAIMAIFIMRLKLFLTPQLCFLAALLARSKFVPRISSHLVVGTLLVLGSFRGSYNLSLQWSVVGEFNNPALEELVQWANGPSVPETAVFAGAMPTMAALRLTTTHPIVNHPHYEDAALRERTQAVYTVYSHQSPQTVYESLQGLLVTHVVVEEPWCFKRYKTGCSFSEVWNEIDPAHQNLPQFCQQLQDSVPEQFKLVFSNNVYRVLQLL